MRFLVATCLLIFGNATLVCSADELRFESGEKQTALLELYTSEGCSSCPRAELWLSKLKSDSGLWRDFVPLAFHVDYWDRLGWRDRFASRTWTERQYAYTSLLHGDSVYTPEFILNGNEWRDWFRHSKPQTPGNRAGTLSAIATDRKNFSISYQRADDSELEAHIALLGCGIDSKVGSGENGGRQLHHDFVVLDHRAKAMKSYENIARADVAIEMTADDIPQKAIAIWITRANQLAPVQAAGGWLGKLH